MSGTAGLRASSPREVIEQFSKRLNRGDVEAALALYEPGAAFVPEPGTVVHGLDAIREALERFVALNPRLSGEIQRVVDAEGTALVINRWALAGTDPAGHPVELAGTSADVLRRQPDGAWRILVDDPWGGGA